MPKGKSKTKKENKQVTLEQALYDCRVALRGIGSTEKNRDAVIGLVFLKFANDKFLRRREDLIQKYGENPLFLNKPSFYLSDNVFYLDEKTRWDYLVAHASDNDIAVKIDTAMDEITKTNPTLEGALPQNLYASLGADKSKLKYLIDSITKINESNFHEEDLIGRTYEYFLKTYAAAGAKDIGEFYTPSSVVRLIVELIEPFEGTVYDPCCGSGGMFVQSTKFIQEHNGKTKNISVIGQESNAETWRLCKMNLAIRGISCNLGQTNASTFLNDQHKDKKMDFIMANPPFNLKGWRSEDELTDDPRWAGYGNIIPPISNANYAWILHIISKLNVTKGRAGFLLANGALNASDQEYELRKQIIEKDVIEAIIVLPRDMFYTTDISTTLWIINMNKKSENRNGRSVRDRTGEILFMDLRTWDQNEEEIKVDTKSKKRKTMFTEEQISSVKDIYSSWISNDRTLYTDTPELCKSATIDEIRLNNYSLAPSRYIEFIDKDELIDYGSEMLSIQQALNEIITDDQDTTLSLKSAFKEIGYELK